MMFPTSFPQLLGSRFAPWRESQNAERLKRLVEPSTREHFSQLLGLICITYSRTGPPVLDSWTWKLEHGVTAAAMVELANQSRARSRLLLCASAVRLAPSFGTHRPTWLTRPQFAESTQRHRHAVAGIFAVEHILSVGRHAHKRTLAPLGSSNCRGLMGRLPGSRGAVTLGLRAP